jgi:hypothetical protein
LPNSSSAQIADLAAEVLSIPVDRLGDVADGDGDVMDLIERRGRIGGRKNAGGGGRGHAREPPGNG